MEHAPMHLTLAHCSELGSRDSNQDTLGFCADEQLGCFVLADGVGGYQGGIEASQAVVSEVLRTFQAAPAERCSDAAWPLDVARAALASARQHHPEASEMNTTVAVLLVNTATAQATWCQLGDSRVYLFRHGRAHKLSHDHSVLQAMLDAGFVPDQPGLCSQQDRNALYAAVGSAETPPTAVCDAPLALAPGDAFLLCSDGFWSLLPEAQMEDSLREAASPEDWVAAMLAQIARPAPGVDMDNFSALAVWAGPRIDTTRMLDGGGANQGVQLGRVAWRA